MEKETPMERDSTNSPNEKQEKDAIDTHKEDQTDLVEKIQSQDLNETHPVSKKVNKEHDTKEKVDETTESEIKCELNKLSGSVTHDNVINDENRDSDAKVQEENLNNDAGYMIKDESRDSDAKAHGENLNKDVGQVSSGDKIDASKDLESKAEKSEECEVEILDEEKFPEPVFDGTEEADKNVEGEGSAWPEKAVALKKFVKEKSVIAVTSVMRVLSRKSDGSPASEEKVAGAKGGEVAEVSPKSVDRSPWNPLSYIMADKGGQELDPPQLIPMKGRVILYTKLGCRSCKEVRSYLHQHRLGYVEINIDVYPSRILELEKFTGSSDVPKVLFNEIVIGGLTELSVLEKSGELQEKIDYLINEAPSFEAPLPPLSGEDDASCSGSIDEFALNVKKMKESIVVKDVFYKMRRFTSCFTGLDAVNFLSEDQYLEREDAVELGRKFATQLFFRHVLDENLFEDGNHFYRFLDDDPIISSQCYNIPRGIIEVKPKPITDIASRLQFITSAILEAYISVDGKHVDYRSIHGSEEFARYLRIIEELQRVEMQDMSREEKLAFFINLYNMMAIHAMLVLGHPAGPLERRSLFGDFKYVIGGCAYSLSAIENGILRSNQRPPYNLMRPFGVKDKRAQIALSYPEPLIHFALVCGSRSGPAIRCYSSGNIDEELKEAACNFLRGGLIIDLNEKVAFVSKILKWYSVDFGKTEIEVLKYASNYLEPAYSEALLHLLADDAQLKVIYQPYDWGLNL